MCKGKHLVCKRRLKHFNSDGCISGIAKVPRTDMEQGPSKLLMMPNGRFCLKMGDTSSKVVRN